MTAAAEVVVPIPALLNHQEPISKHPARFKVLRYGRRWGKDRLAFNAAWFGHGPGFSYPGIVDGWDVAWLAPDFKQGRGIWDEEIVPRFVKQDVPGIAVNQQERTVIASGLGGLHFYSAENMKSIRGLGKRLKGVIINEAAHLDLASAWRDVIRPALMDNQGWALIMSTTNAGTDGGLDDLGNRRVPSFFNELCEQIRAGNRDDDWAEFWGTAEENPKIGPTEFQALVREYPEGSVALDQEIYAKLLTPGAGLAFPEWRDDQHVVQTAWTVPSHWELGAGFDWGYWQPSAFVLIATGEESQSVAIQERRWTQTDGFQMGHDIGKLCSTLDRPVRLIAADSSIWGVEAKGNRGFPNQAEEIQGGISEGWKAGGKDGAAPWLFAVPKGHDSRVMRVQLLHKYLKVTEHGPRLRFLKSAAQCIGGIPKLPPDPQNPEDVDTKSDDHFYDALTYYLLSRPPLVDAPPIPKPQDVHPGLESRYKRQLQQMGLLSGEGKAPAQSRYKPKNMTRLS